MKLAAVDDSITKLFEHRFFGKTTYELDQLKVTGTPLFTKEDIFATTGLWDRILRGLCVRDRITVEYFNERYKDYALNVVFMAEGKVNTEKNNLLKAIKRGGITTNRFMVAVCNVLGYEISKVDLIMTTKQGKDVSITTDDLADL